MNYDQYMQQTLKPLRMILDPTTGEFVPDEKSLAEMNLHGMAAADQMQQPIQPQQPQQSQQPQTLSALARPQVDNTINNLMQKISAMSQPGYKEKHPDMAYTSRIYNQGVPDIQSRPEFQQLQTMLALQKAQGDAGKAQLQANQTPEQTPEQKRANEIIAAAERSKLPYTAEGARLAEQARADAKAKAGEEGKPLPISAATALMSNQQNLRRAQEAQALLSGKNVGKAVGDMEATGWKGYAPDAMLQRLDPQGIDTRAAIADLGSLVIHDRSGAAVTALEFPRLQPFIPSPKDAPATARKKLKRFVMEYQNIVDEQTGFYKESGYKVPTEKLKQSDVKRTTNDGVPPMETWVARAKELNPDMSGAEIEAEYMKKYRR